jgi:hypothetical protein
MIRRNSNLASINNLLSYQKEIKRQLQYEARRDFWIHVFYSIVGGLIIAWLVASIKSGTIKPTDKELASSALHGFLFAVLIFLYFICERIYGRRKLDGYLVNKITEDSLQQLLEMGLYADILDGKKILRPLWGLAPVVSIALKESLEKGGGILIKAGKRLYLDLLSSALSGSRASFEAILTEACCPLWFYSGIWEPVSTDKLKRDLGESQSFKQCMNEEKGDYLEKVYEAPISEKTRILIMEECDVVEQFEYGNWKVRREFIKLNKGFALYQASPSKIDKYLGNQENSSITVKELGDYAIFDRGIVLRLMQNGEQVFASIGELHPYDVIFKLLQNESKFHKRHDGRRWEESTHFKRVTRKKIGKRTWEEAYNNLTKKEKDYVANTKGAQNDSGELCKEEPLDIVG